MISWSFSTRSIFCMTISIASLIRQNSIVKGQLFRKGKEKNSFNLQVPAQKQNGSSCTLEKIQELVVGSNSAPNKTVNVSSRPALFNRDVGRAFQRKWTLYHDRVSLLAFHAKSCDLITLVIKEDGIHSTSSIEYVYCWQTWFTSIPRLPPHNTHPTAMFSDFVVSILSNHDPHKLSGPGDIYLQIRQTKTCSITTNKKAQPSLCERSSNALSLIWFSPTSMETDDSITPNTGYGLEGHT